MSKHKHKIYVANRLTEIHKNSSPGWRHIPVKINPADNGKQGLASSDIPSNGLNHPTFWGHLKIPKIKFSEDTDIHICTTQKKQLHAPVILIKKIPNKKKKTNYLRPPTLRILHQMGPQQGITSSRCPQKSFSPNTFILVNHNFISWLMLFLLKKSKSADFHFHYYL